MLVSSTFAFQVYDCAVQSSQLAPTAFTYAPQCIDSAAVSLIKEHNRLTGKMEKGFWILDDSLCLVARQNAVVDCSSPTTTVDPFIEYNVQPHSTIEESSKSLFDSINLCGSQTREAVIWNTHCDRQPHKTVLRDTRHRQCNPSHGLESYH